MTTRTPELSLYLTTYTDGPHHDWRATLGYARDMDAAGVDRMVVSDHVVFGENLDVYADPTIGGQADGRQPTGPDGSWLEPLTVLTAIAATTTRIRLGTAVLLAALRRPAVLAKQLATLDVLSEGRVDLGVGVGWQREEYEAVGLSFEDRGRVVGAYLRDSGLTEYFARRCCQIAYIEDSPTGRVIGGRIYRVMMVEPGAGPVRRNVAPSIGALPSLADGSEPRPLTQEWARGSYEDKPAGLEATGVRYRTGYNFGYSLALWDCEDDVDARGTLQDKALNERGVLVRLQVQMGKPLISVATASADDCEECQKVLGRR